MRGKGKSSHDLTDDPTLSTEIEDRQELVNPKDEVFLYGLKLRYKGVEIHEYNKLFFVISNRKLFYCDFK